MQICLERFCGMRSRGAFCSAFFASHRCWWLPSSGEGSVACEILTWISVCLVVRVRPEWHNVADPSPRLPIISLIFLGTCANPHINAAYGCGQMEGSITRAMLTHFLVNTIRNYPEANPPARSVAFGIGNGDHWIVDLSAAGRSKARSLPDFHADMVVGWHDPLGNCISTFETCNILVSVSWPSTRQSRTDTESTRPLVPSPDDLLWEVAAERYLIFVGGGKLS
ncbi:hypothetical protein BU23DRAFT_183389 [Bimuria novae-zelandiae CBS 107.79]|uniref:Uncharacterized protein n=1 Tax=Bimuria novae-zelandiae CBS 107.79 TaxID=1447943 RepID=A0A6A5V5H2_9PLEO|nr:hypothetical protein BU23DRAFT_183389 [Bimuria novae-zelandiae CBS 107.79]